MRSCGLINATIILVALNVSLINCKRTGEKCYGDLCKFGKQNYPSQEIEQLLSQHMYIEKQPVKTVVEPAGTLQMRMNPMFKKQNLCNSRTVTIFPTFDMAENVTIVNQKQYPQRVSFEICRNSGFCAKLNMSLTYETSCKQLYNKIRLLILNKNQLQHRLYTIPSACVCVYSKKLAIKEN